MKRTTCMLLSAVILPLLSFSQSFKYRKYKFEWSLEKPAAIAVEEQFKNEDAVILEEKVIYNAGGNYLPAYYFLNRTGNYFFVDEGTQGVSPVVQKHVRIKFFTQKGIKKFSKIVLPESFDPSSDYSTVIPEQRDTLYRPKGEFECIRYFSARIIKPDGKIVNAVIDETIQTAVNRVNTIDRKFYSWIFRILNLEESDELEMDYSYEGAYNLEPSTRIFFNGEVPKQNYKLTFRYPAKSTFIITCNNGATPYDSVMVTESAPHYTEYYFSAKNLMGVSVNRGGRPFRQLPYMTYYYHKNDFGIEDPKTKFIEKPLPYPWAFVLLSYVGYQYDDLKMRMERRDKATRVMNQFVINEKQKVKDTSLAAIMSSIQHTLAADFEFKRDIDYFSGDNGELEHLGKYVEEKVLREISRQRLYEEILNRLDKDYFYAPLVDKRVSSINFEKFEYQTTWRSAYAVPFKNSFLYLYPKSYRFGYEANELPFYYEDARTILVPQHEESDKKRDIVPRINFTFVKTPYSGVKDNIRSTNAVINVALDSMTVTFNARIKLSGQFSTITRGYYLYGNRDTTVNPSYYKTISDLADKGTTAEVKVTSSTIQFPYDASVNVNFINHSMLKKESQSTYALDLSEWFNNVIDDEFAAQNRHLDYFPDFQFQDSHKYMVKFDRKVKLQNPEGFQKTIENPFAQYILKTSQVDDQSILLETTYIVKPEFVPADKAADVGAVFSAIKELNSNALKLKIE